MVEFRQRPRKAWRQAAPVISHRPTLTARERIGLALLAADRARRGAIAHVRRSRLLRWRYRAAADDLLIAPPDLRARDPSFAEEITSGTFGLAGTVAHLNGRSPFAVIPPNGEWARELHGFAWLRHLDPAISLRTDAIARAVVGEWLALTSPRDPYAWLPEVTARRVVSWLAHAGLVLNQTAPRFYTTVMESLSNQVTYLAASWCNAPAGYPRLLALIGLVHADLCFTGHDQQLAESEKQLALELERQVLPDGGHVSRNPAVLIDLLLDLLPLRQCFTARGRKPDQRILAAIGRIGPMLRHLRLGDGMLARFNGMGATERDALATVLAYDENPSAPSPAISLRSGYARLERGPTAIVMDAGAPPPLELAGTAGAGCLAFELSIGREVLLANAGAPPLANARYRAAARATANHNTLSLREHSSSKLIRNARLERRLGAPPIRHPDRVTCDVRDVDGTLVLEASHDGYRQQFGLVHTRTLRLDGSGLNLTGVDVLAPAKGVLRFSWDVPFGIHFHLHPSAMAELGASPDTVELTLASGEAWRLSAVGAAVSLEDSVYFADLLGAQRRQQVVLRSVCSGEAEVTWTIERLEVSEASARTLARREGRPPRLSERLAETTASFEPIEKK